MAGSHDRVTIKIPRKLYENLSVIIQDSGFSSVTDFIVYVLRDLAASKHVEGDSSLTRQEVDLVKRRLKSLGYL